MEGLLLAGLHTFTLSVTEWCDKTNAIGIYSKRGKYGGPCLFQNLLVQLHHGSLDLNDTV